MENHLDLRLAKKARGFSLVELSVTLLIICVLLAIALPSVLTQIYITRIRYSASDLSGLLQRARMEAVRKNRFYSLQSVAGSPALEEVVDNTNTVVASIPPAVMAPGVTVFFGSGSGAPAESTMLAGLNFTTATGSAGLPSFNSRGLPCIPVGGATCPITLGQGFVFFVSGTNSSAGNLGWTAVAVTPSGRCEVWVYDGTNWTQQ